MLHHIGCLKEQDRGNDAGEQGHADRLKDLAPFRHSCAHCGKHGQMCIRDRLITVDTFFFRIFTTALVLIRFVNLSAHGMLLNMT